MFTPVSREENRLRLALDGPAGSGKTYTALRFAFTIAQRYLTKVGVIDTEHRSASLYAGDSPDGVPWRWEGANLEHFAPSTYTEAIKEAARRGYGVLVIDSLSHAWMGTGGALDQVDRASSSRTAGGKFGAWRDVTPQHNAMVDAILRYPGHVIATLRSKMEYVFNEDERGKKTVEKIGLKPIQREGVEYEFAIVGDLDAAHVMRVSKTRCSAIDGLVVSKPGPEFLSPVLDWLEGAEPPALASEEQVETIKALAGEKGVTRETLEGILRALEVSRLVDMSAVDAGEFIRRLESKPAPVPAKRKIVQLAGEPLAKEIKALWAQLDKPVEDLVGFLESKGVKKVAQLSREIGVMLHRRLIDEHLEREGKEAF